MRTLTKQELAVMAAEKTRFYDKQLKWVLRDKASGEELKPGDRVSTGDGNRYSFMSGRPPHKPSSSGFVNIKGTSGETYEVYAHVIGAMWVKE